MVLPVVLLPSFQPVRQTVRRLRRVEQQRIRVQLRQVHSDHGLCGLHRGFDEFHVPPAHHELVILDRRQVFEEQLHLVAGQSAYRFFPAGERRFIRAGIQDSLLRGKHEKLRVGQLLIQKLDRRAERSLLRLLPEGPVIPEEVRRRVKADLVAVFPRQYLRLTDVGVILRLQAPGRAYGPCGIELFRRDISFLRCDDLLELPGTAPDLIQLIVRERRLALGGLAYEDTVGCIIPTVALHHTTGEPAHGGVAAPFLNGVTAVLALVHTFVEVLLHLF